MIALLVTAFFLIMSKLSVTLIELIIVVIVIAILITFGAPALLRAQARAIDREAHTNLRLLRTAQLFNELEAGEFLSCNSNTQCNNLLDIDLPPAVANGGNWNYSVTVGGGGSRFTAFANGTRGTQNRWRVTHAIDEPY